MVCHTGVFDSAVKAVEAVDAAVNEVVTAVPCDLTYDYVKINGDYRT